MVVKSLVRRIENMLMVAIGMNGGGHREVLGVCEGAKEGKPG
jgi:hypothetical protein